MHYFLKMNSHRKVEQRAYQSKQQAETRVPFCICISRRYLTCYYQVFLSDNKMLNREKALLNASGVRDVAMWIQRGGKQPERLVERWKYFRAGY